MDEAEIWSKIQERMSQMAYGVRLRHLRNAQGTLVPFGQAVTFLRGQTPDAIPGNEQKRPQRQGLSYSSYSGCLPTFQPFVF